jgi:hypothetical protein
MIDFGAFSEQQLALLQRNYQPGITKIKYGEEETEYITAGDYIKLMEYLKNANAASQGGGMRSRKTNMVFDRNQR